MTSRLELVFTRKAVAFSGVAALALIAALAVLPNLMAESLEPERAAQWIRHHLKQLASAQQMAALAAEQRATPNRADAKRWREALLAADHTEFVAVEVKHFLVAPPGSSRRIFVARVITQEGGKTLRTRYFSLSAENNAFDFFWVREQSRWMWLLSF